MSKALLALLAAGGVAVAASGCATSVSPTARATSVAHLECDGAASDAADVHVLQSTSVLSAGPLYAHVITGKNDAEERVTGARLLVRAPEGVSAERLQRILQCHSAQVLLGQVDPSRFADEPYWLPDAWVDIHVQPDDGGMAVTVSAQSIPEGLKVLHRATAFAETHPTGTAAP